MNAKYVQLIALVAEAGSLGAAAMRLNKSQPAVSKALQAAEAEIGVRIFKRSPAGVVPTIEGQRVIDRCQRICRDLDLLDEDIAQVRGEVKGTLNLAVSPLAAVRIVPVVLRRFLRIHPRIQVQVVGGGHSRQALQLLRIGRADYVLGPKPQPSDASGLRSKELVRTGFAFITGKTSRYLGETDPRVLQQAPWLVIGPRGRRPHFNSYFEQQGLKPPHPVVCSDSILTIMSLIEGTDFVSSCPAHLLPDLTSKWEISEIPQPHFENSITLTLTATVDRVPTAAALAFEDTVEAVADQMRREGHNLEL